MKNNDEVKATCGNLVAALSAEKQIMGCLCFGSRAIGCNDETSDFDLFVFFQGEVPSVSRRVEIYRGLGDAALIEADERPPDEQDGWCVINDKITDNGVYYDITANTTAWITAIADQVLENGALSVPELGTRCYTMLGLLTHSVILFERDSFLTTLIARLHPYPAALRTALVKKSVSELQELSNDLAICHRRKLGNMVYFFYVSKIMDEMEELLFAINDIYNPASKHSEYLLSKMEGIPLDLRSQFQEVLRDLLPSDHRAKSTQALRLLIENAVKLAGQV